MLKSDCSYIHLPLGKVTGSEHTKLFNSTVCSLQNQWNNQVCLEDSCTSKRTNCASNSCNYNNAACNASLPHLSSSDRNPTLVINTTTGNMNLVNVSTYSTVFQVVLTAQHLEQQVKCNFELF